VAARGESTAAGPGRASLQERVEHSVAGRIVISLFILLTLVTVLTANLPTSRLQHLLLSADHPYLYATGLDQNWGVFSPEPRRETIHISAVVTFADGSRTTWRVKKEDPLVGEYRDYRWLKWSEFVVSPAYEELWKPAALYVARRVATRAHRPVKVELENHYWALQPPGHIPDHPFVQQRRIYTTPITEAMLRGDAK
jgi:hypothetical protein